jgi:Peptidase family M23
VAIRRGRVAAGCLLVGWQGHFAKFARLVIWAGSGRGPIPFFCGSCSVKLKLVAPFVLLAILFSVSNASASPGREVNASNILRGGPYYVLSEHGVPNGMPCEWYAYATTVGLAYCAHPGIDISASYENLYAATDGVIEFAGSDAAYWPNHVDIRVTSDRYVGELHIYGHMSQVFVEPGQAVKKGDLLGISGEAGGAPHVHFERRTAPNAQCAAGCAIDPEPPLHGGQDIQAEPKPDEHYAKKTEPELVKDEDKKSDVKSAEESGKSEKKPKKTKQD